LKLNLRCTGRGFHRSTFDGLNKFFFESYQIIYSGDSLIYRTRGRDPLDRKKQKGVMDERVISAKK